MRKINISKKTAIISISVVLIGCVIMGVWFFYPKPIKNYVITADPKGVHLAGDTGTVLQVGAKAPNFELESVLGDKIELSDYIGSSVLVSFIYVHDSSQYSDVKADGTRAQVNFIKSMINQYGESGLKVIFVNEAHLVDGKETTMDKLTNYYYDNELGDTPLLMDNSSRDVARKYGINALPTTYLIDKEGIINQKWENTALSSQLAAGIEGLGINSYLNASEGSQDQESDNWSTPAQAIFPGLISARAFSEKVWAIDGGIPWKSGGNYPIKIVVLDDNEQVTIKLTAINEDTKESLSIISKNMEKINEDETINLLSNMPGIDTYVHMLDVPVAINIPGNYTIRAEVTVNDISEVSGEIKVLVK